MNEPNAELILDVLATIERDPASWRQAHWGLRTLCGTSHCFAGHALRLSGAKFDWQPVIGNNDAEVAHWADVDGEYRYISAPARELLGLTFSQSEALFHPNNTLTRLYRLCAEFLGVEVEVLRDKVRGRL